MNFIYLGKEYVGESAVGVVRALEADTRYGNKDGPIRDFLVWSLEELADQIPARELDVSPSLSDETIAFNYLCLLDNHDIGSLNPKLFVTKGLAN